MRYLLAALSLTTFAPSSSAHHATFATFDGDKIEEIQGEIMEALWRNPHVRLTVAVGGSAEETWEIETDSVSSLRSMDISSALLSVGDTVRIAGNPARNGENAMWATNILLSDNREFVIGARTEPRWGDSLDRALGKTGSEYATAGDSSEPERGIYRVWSSTAATPMLLPETVDENFDLNSYPLTASARAAVAAFDPVTDNPTANCTPKGMPTIMEQPYPMEILEQGENIVLRTEEYDLERLIHIAAEPAGEEIAPTPPGYSVGRWDGTTLVVTTNRISWRHFDQAGIPLSEAVEIVEYFSPTEDGSRMDYRMSVTDPSTFTEPVELQKHWFYISGVSVEPYECVNR